MPLQPMDATWKVWLFLFDDTTIASSYMGNWVENVMARMARWRELGHETSFFNT